MAETRRSRTLAVHDRARPQVEPGAQSQEGLVKNRSAREGALRAGGQARHRHHTPASGQPQAATHCVSVLAAVRLAPPRDAIRRCVLRVPGGQAVRRNAHGWFPPRPQSGIVPLDQSRSRASRHPKGRRPTVRTTPRGRWRSLLPSVAVPRPGGGTLCPGPSPRSRCQLNRGWLARCR